MDLSNVNSQYINASLSNIEEDVHILFKFQKENGYIELVLDEEQKYPCNGWSVRSHIYPNRVIFFK